MASWLAQWRPEPARSVVIAVGIGAIAMGLGLIVRGRAEGALVIVFALYGLVMFVSGMACLVIGVMTWEAGPPAALSDPTPTAEAAPSAGPRTQPKR